MIRVMDIRGMPVICLRDGNRVGYVFGPMFDENECLTGFLIDGKGMSLSKRYVALDNVLRIDKNSCVIYSEASIERVPKGHAFKKRTNYEEMLGRNVKSKSGRGLGVVKDLVYSTETGTIEGLELSRGFMEDAMQGRNVVMVRDGVEFGEEYIIVGRDDV